MAALKARELDLMTGVVATEKRRAELSFTDPYLQSRVVVFGASDASYTGTLSGLRAITDGEVDGYVGHAHVVQHTIDTE